MSQARLMGVSEEWIEKVSLANTAHHQLFMVSKRTFEPNEPKDGSALLEGDVLLTLNEKLITRISELDVMYSHTVLKAIIVRDCKELRMKLPTMSADDVETDHAVSFCGAVLHRPHQAVCQQISNLFSNVYVSARTRGSPAYQYGLAPTNFITHVNATATPDLKSFIAAVVQIPDNTCMLSVLLTHFPTYVFFMNHPSYSMRNKKLTTENLIQTSASAPSPSTAYRGSSP